MYIVYFSCNTFTLFLVNLFFSLFCICLIILCLIYIYICMLLLEDFHCHMTVTPLNLDNNMLYFCTHQSSLIKKSNEDKYLCEIGVTVARTLHHNNETVNECFLTLLFSVSHFLLNSLLSVLCLSIFLHSSSSTLSLPSFLTLVTFCAAQKITQLIIRHFIWQRANSVCTQSPIHVKVSRKRKEKRKQRNRGGGKGTDREASIFL